MTSKLINPRFKMFFIVQLSQLIGFFLLMIFSISCGSANKSITIISNPAGSLIESRTTHSDLFVVSGNVDLKGQSIALPEFSVLDLRNGSIRNGTLILNNTEIRCKDTQGLNCDIQGECSNKKLVVNNKQYGANQIAALGGNAECILKSDLTITKPLAVRCSIKGTGCPRINSEESIVLLNLMSSNIKLHNLNLEINGDSRDTHCYAIRATDVGNIQLKELIVNGGSVYFRNKNDVDYHNYEISNCSFIIDHSKCNQSFEKQNDAFEFRGVQNVLFHDNTITTTNVTRVFKTPAGGVANTPCDNLVFYNNVIQSISVNGKQVFDFYNYTRNVTIKNNVIIAKGHTDIFENKTIGDASFLNVIIEGNTVEYGYTLLYFNLSKESNNSLIVRNNRFSSTSSDGTRTSVQYDTIITNKRLYDINLRNLHTVIFEDNTFYSIGYVDSRLFYIEDIHCISLNKNVFSGSWKNIAWFNRNINDVEVVDNIETVSIKTIKEPVVVLSSANVNCFKSFRNEFKGRGGAHYLLQNESEIKRAEIQEEGRLKQKDLFLDKGKSKIINYIVR